MNYFYYRKPWLFEESELFIPIKLESLKVPIFTVDSGLDLLETEPLELLLNLNNEKSVSLGIGIYTVTYAELNFTVNLSFVNSLEMDVSNSISNLEFSLYLNELTVRNELRICGSENLNIYLNTPLYDNSAEASLIETVISVNAVNKVNLAYKVSAEMELWAGDLIAFTVEEIYCNLNFIKSIKIDSDIGYNVIIDEKMSNEKTVDVNMECYPILTFSGLTGLLFHDLEPLLFKDLLLKTW